MSHPDCVPPALLVVLSLLSGCTHGGPTAAHHAEPHWAYAGEGGPAQWGQLSPEYASCSEGQLQSPIDLGAAVGEELPALALEYQPTPLALVNNGHTIQQPVAPGSALTLEGKRFELKQLHFHAPSEHALGGRYFPMELHLVHQGPDGALAVVGIFLAEGSKNVALAPVFDVLASGAGEAGKTIDLAGVLPAIQKHSRYRGSLTTPPCTEGVQWLVMGAPSEVSPEQLAAFTALYPHNARPVMPVNGRKVGSTP